MDITDTEDKFIIINIKKNPVQRYSSASSSMSELTEPLPIHHTTSLSHTNSNHNSCKNCFCILLFIMIILFIILYAFYSLLFDKK